MKPGAIKPIYRSKAFLLGLVGFFGILGVWVDSCRYATSWESHVIPKSVSTNFGMMQGTMGVGVWLADSTRPAPVSWRRERHAVGFGPEMATVVDWRGDGARVMIRVWKLVAMYLAYWSVLMAWRAWTYRRVGRASRVA